MSLTSTRPRVSGVSALQPTGLTSSLTGGINTKLPIGGASISGGGGLFSGINPTGIASGLLSGFLSDLNLKENIGNVLQYGFSSWGASTNPEKEIQDLEAHVLPIIDSYLRGANENNLAEVLSVIDGFIMFTHTGYKYLLAHHTKAGATRAAYNKAMSKLMEMRANIVDKMINDLKAKGVKVSTGFKGVDFNELENTYTWHTGGKFGRKQQYTVRFRTFSFTIPQTQEVITDENGNTQVKEKSSSSLASLVIKGGLAYLLARFI